MKCEFLLPYSPDFNLIELAFLAMKYHLCCNSAYNQMAMTEVSDEEIHIMLFKSIYIVSPQDSYGRYRHVNISELTFALYSSVCIVPL
jgi:hypothetical protein